MKVKTHPEKLKNKFLILATVAFLITMQAVAFGKIFYDDMIILQQNQKIRVQNVKDRRWDFIVSICNENLLRAEIIAKQIKEEIKGEMSKYYSNDKKLEYDLQNPGLYNKFTEILSKATEGIYLNVDNDNNDPFIMVYFGCETNHETGELIQNGYVALDRSYNTSTTTGGVKNLSDIVGLQANPKVAAECLEIILNNNTNTKQPLDRVWQYLKPSTKELLISGANWMSVRYIYDKYGVDALKTLEVLHNEYIEESSGVFGNPDVNALGQRQKTIKIIVTQGFNPYEALIIHHQSKLEAFEEDIINIKKEIQTELGKKKLIMFLLGMLCLAVVIAVIAIQNTLADLIDAEYNRR